MRQTFFRRGFTLIEILTVVVILGIASAVIIPNISSNDDLKSAAAARIVMADLIWAQNKAISTQQKYYISFSGQQYSIYSRAKDTDALAAVTNPVLHTNYLTVFGAGGKPGLEHIAVGTVNFGSASILGFDELGSPFAYTSTGNVIAPLVSQGQVNLTSGTYNRRINIEPYTGEVNVQ